jgi:ketosteroid isomerase-like protein
LFVVKMSNPIRKEVNMQYEVTHEGSLANGETLVALYDAFATCDVDTIMATLTDDIEWRVNGPSPVAGVYHGRKAVLAFLGQMMAQYEGTLRVELVAVLADDRYGEVRVAECAERPGDGVSYSGVHLWEFRDGRCCRFESLYDDAYTRFWTAAAAERGVSFR